ncbi:hypothetical protein K469DRAFT_544583, partial [Zopfia rhizophila CBS 207.26]
YKERLYISNINKLKAKLLYFYHKSPITSYIDYNKIYVMDGNSKVTTPKKLKELVITANKTLE